MIARIVSLCLWLTVGLFLPTVVKAEEPAKSSQPGAVAPADAVTQAQLQAELGQLEKRLNGKIDELINELKGTQQQPTAPPAASEPTGPVTREEVNNLWRLARNNQQEVTHLEDEVVDSRERLGQITREIGASPSGNLYTLNIRGLMDTSPAFRDEMKNAVSRSLERTGTLQVENRMGTSQLLRINHRDEWIPPYTTRTFREPVGTVTTELVGYEAEKHLTIAAPTNLQRLVVAPSQRPTQIVYRPNYDVGYYYSDYYPIVGGSYYYYSYPLWYAVW